MSDVPEVIQRAARVFPGGVLGSHRSGPGLEFVVREGRGAYLWDTTGRRYIDYLRGSGPMLLGHAHPAVVGAVQRQLSRGTTYMLLNEPVIELAEELVRAVKCCEQVRFTSSGSEATFFALRVARAYRGRDKILKFEGGWHGTHDYGAMSVSTRSPKAFPAPTPDSGGVPHAVESTVLVAPYNDLATTEAIIAAHHEELAAVICEPYQRVVVPAPGFLQGVRAVTRRYGVPLIFDEIVTGFRLAYGGAQEYYGVVPDLVTLGKVIAGGFPLGAVGGSAEIMRHFDPALEGTSQYVWQSGTLNGNPIAAAAGLATLGELRKPGTYERDLEEAREPVRRLDDERGLHALLRCNAGATLNTDLFAVTSAISAEAVTAAIPPACRRPIEQPTAIVREGADAVVELGPWRPRHGARHFVPAFSVLDAPAHAFRFELSVVTSP